MNAAARLLNQGVLSRGWVVSVILNKSQLLPATMVLAILVSSLGIVYLTNTTRSLNASIEQTLAERDRLHVQAGQLLLEKSTQIMQGRIQNIAESHYQMVVPDNKSVVVVKE